jgi:hypothetical protein
MPTAQSSDPRVARPGSAPETAAPVPAALTRRRFLGRLGGGAALTLAAAGALPLSRGWLAAGLAAGAVVGPESPDERRRHAYEIRHEATRFHKARPWPAHPTNGDEECYATRLGNYSKALLHDALGQGVPGHPGRGPERLSAGAEWSRPYPVYLSSTGHQGRTTREQRLSMRESQGLQIRRVMPTRHSRLTSAAALNRDAPLGHN